MLQCKVVRGRGSRSEKRSVVAVCIFFIDESVITRVTRDAVVDCIDDDDDALEMTSL